jgi:hypothetical protein
VVTAFCTIRGAWLASSRMVSGMYRPGDRQPGDDHDRRGRCHKATHHHEVGREGADGVVVGQHRVVVVLARVADAGLGVGQLLLQRQEILVGLQVGIVLRHGEQALQRTAEGVLGDGLLGRATGVDGLDAGPG